MKRSHIARDIIEIIVLAFVIFLVVRFVLQSYRVNDTSMQPNLQTNEYVLVNKTAYLFHQPDRGDVIVFHYPFNTQIDYVKRIIARPGDTIDLDSTTVRVNGVLLKEPYISMPVNAIAIHRKLGPNEYFVMGDNRNNSGDSRNWGPLDGQFIVGKAIMVYWPINHLRLNI